ncbi:MAG TPA: four helix bundle protein [Gemmatimonadaceae bacterium]
MGNHRDLLVWQRASAFAGRIDVETRRMARGHGELADQLRRAALSVPTNLAEGASKGRDAEFLRFINISIGSAAELDSLLAHAAAVGAFDRQAAAEVTDDLTVIRKMLFKLRGALQRSGDGHVSPTTRA